MATHGATQQPCGQHVVRAKFKPLSRHMPFAGGAPRSTARWLQLAELGACKTWSLQNLVTHVLAGAGDAGDHWRAASWLHPAARHAWRTARRGADRCSHRSAHRRAPWCASARPGENLLGSQNLIHSTASAHEYDNVTWRASTSSPVAALFADRLREPRRPCAEDFPSCAGSAAALAAPSQQATRHARRVYVGGLPPTANEQNIATFMSNALAAVGGTTAGPGEHLKTS